MLLSLEAITSLSESELRSRFLVPLFIAMGFREVTETHGPDEYGKDIVMWKPDIVRSRENYAVVVKAGDINAKNREDVLRQISEAFGESYRDPVTGQETSVDRVIVVASGKITDHSRRSIRSSLLTAKKDGLIDFLDKHLIVERAREYLSKELIWKALQQAHAVLNESFGDFRFGVSVLPDGTTSVMIADRPGRESLTKPIRVSISPRLPSTSEGAEKAAELQRWLLEGDEVELGQEFLEEFEVPEVVRVLMADAKIKSVKLGPSRIAENLTYNVTLLGNKGGQLDLGYVHFTHSQSGKNGVTLSNLAQPAPFRIKLRFDKQDKTRGRLGISWDLGKPAHALFAYQAAMLGQILSEGGRALLRETNTGMPTLDISFEAEPTDPVDPQLLAVLRNLATVQTYGNVLITVGSADFSADEVQDIEKMACAASKGHLIVQEGASLTMELAEVAPENASKLLEADEKVRFSQVYPTDGYVEIRGEKAFLGRELVQYEGPFKILEHDKDASSFKIKVDAAPDHPITVIFLDWLDRRSAQLRQSKLGSNHDASSMDS